MNQKLYSFLKSHHRLRNLAIFISRGPIINLFNPNFWYCILKSSRRTKNINKLKIDYSIDNTEYCLNEGIKWFLYNQKNQPDNGISSQIHFSLWKIILGGSFPEVTGYIIPTLFDYSSTFNDNNVFKSAILASEFLLDFQNDDGSFPEGNVGSLGPPSVFNTGMIIHGLVRAYKETNNNKYLNAAINASDWIVSVQMTDGSWKRFNYMSLKRTYDTKVSQSLLELWEIRSDEKYLKSAESNLNWVLSNQKLNGWFYNCDNSTERNNSPLTHLIGYTVQGLIACYKYTQNQKLIDASVNTLNRLLHIFEISKKPLLGRYNSLWKPTTNSSCVTGNAQISLCWMDIYELNDDFRYLNAAFKMNDFLKSIQYKCHNKKIKGAIPQSYPFWGDYGPYKINSWDLKYYLDALLNERKLKMHLLKLVK